MLSKAIEQTPTPTHLVKRKAIKLLDMEASKCNRDGSVPYDICIWDRYPSDQTGNIAEVLTALYYRGRIQLAIMNVFLMLVHRGFVSIDTLQKPVTLRLGKDNYNKIHLPLCTLEAIVQEDGFELSGGPCDLWSLRPAYEALDWLAAMIVRSCTPSLDQILEAIRESEYLGDIDKGEFERHDTEVQDKNFVCNPNERTPEERGLDSERYSRELRENNDFGFWLPHGLGDISEAEIFMEIDNGIRYFHEIERGFRDYFDL